MLKSVVLHPVTPGLILSPVGSVPKTETENDDALELIQEVTEYGSQRRGHFTGRRESRYSTRGHSIVYISWFDFWFKTFSHTVVCRRLFYTGSCT